MLMLAYQFPPMKTVSMRNYYFYCEYKKYCEEVVVLSTSNQNLMQQEPLPVNPGDLQLCKTLDYRTLLQFRYRGHINQSESSKGKVVRFLMRLLDSFPMNCLLGEGGLLYILNGYFLGKKIIRNSGVTHLHSSFRPYSDHIIAWLLKRRFPKLTWTADMRDLHVDPSVGNVVFPCFQHWCNRQILSRADFVLTVSQGLAQHLYRYNADKIRVLRYGVGQIPSPVSNPVRFKKFTFVYTGSLFMNKRDPSPLLVALQELMSEKALRTSDFQLVYAGKDGKSWKRYMEKHQLGKVSKDLGVLALSEARQLQSDAHINLLLTYSTNRLTGNLSSKLFEYLAARRPILVLLNGPTDEELQSIINRTQAGIVAGYSPSDISKIKSFLLEKFNEWQVNGQVVPSVPEGSLKELRWENIVKNYFGEAGILNMENKAAKVELGHEA